MIVAPWRLLCVLVCLGGFLQGCASEPVSIWEQRGSIPVQMSESDRDLAALRDRQGLRVEPARSGQPLASVEPVKRIEEGTAPALVAPAVKPKSDLPDNPISSLLVSGAAPNVVEPDALPGKPVVSDSVTDDEHSVPAAASLEEQKQEKQPGFWARLFGGGRSEGEADHAGTAAMESLPAEELVISGEPKDGGEKTVLTDSAVKMAGTNGVSYVNPVLKPGLLVKVVVLASGKKEVDEERKRISPAGDITLPLVGAVPVDGLTIRDLAKTLKDLYAKYFREPMVDVEFVLEDPVNSVSPWGYVTVLGRVKKPGRISIPPTSDLSLSMAVQLAGGLDSSAKLTGIKITRETDGKTDQFSVDLQSVGDQGAMDSDVILKPGDVVFVPERVF